MNNGGIQVFVIGIDNALWYFVQGGWFSLGGTLRDNSDPAVITNPDGRLQAFVVGSSGAVFYRSQNSEGSISPASWSPYASLGGGVRFDTSPASVCKEKAILESPLTDSCSIPVDITPSRIQVFVVGNDGALWHSWRTGI